MESKTEMNVSLTPEFERYINEKVKSGLYSTASEVVREGLRIMQERDRFNAARLKQLRDDIQVGLDQLARGDGVDGEKAFARILRKGRSPRKPKMA